jgi:hypothetical protein
VKTTGTSSMDQFLFASVIEEKKMSFRYISVHMYICMNEAQLVGIPVAIL